MRPINEMFGITPELIEHVKASEGFVSKPYKCPAGYPTQGYGRRVKSLDLPAVSEQEAEAWLVEDLEDARDQALDSSPGLVANERRLAAITDFVFNLGGEAYAGSTLRVRVNAEDWKSAAKENKRWVYAGPKGKKKILPGLVTRREVTSKWLAEG